MNLMPTLITSVERGLHGFVYNLPAFLTGLVIVVVSWYAARLIGHQVWRMTGPRMDESLARALGHLTRFAIVLGGWLTAAVIVFPSVKPSDVLTFLGFGGVAVGFAFKDIFQNFLAGLLLLFRQPFRLGDQIRSGDLEGTVEDINLRTTVLKTYDGERVLIPNSDVFTQPILVRTAYGKRRSHFVVGIGYPDDIEQAKQAITAAIEELPGVLDEPAPWVRTIELSDSSVNLQVYYWTKAEQAEVVKAADAVATAIKHALDQAGIDMPYPVRRVLLSDGTTVTAGQPEAERRSSVREEA